MELTPSKRSEPWFQDNLPTEWSKQDEIEFNQIRRQRLKWEYFQSAYDFIVECGVRGDYHEFGCHRARTFRMSLIEAKRHFLDIGFFAYDSFEGLPEAADSDNHENIHWKSNTLATSVEEFYRLISASGLPTERVEIIEGFYDESLQGEQAAKIALCSKASLICIDCDLYKSAVPVFNYIENILQEGTLLYIDDYHAGYKGNPNKGVSKAAGEFFKKSRFRFEPHLNVGAFGRSFITYT